ncbi:MAG: signal peptide peptidase SppA, partial [Phycisphaerae bacterium]
VEKRLQETVVIREQGLWPAKIALIDVSGILVDQRRPELLGEGEHPVSLLAEKLDKAASDRAVKAVVVRINSPGGSVTASDLIHHQIRSFKVRTGKPVVAVLMDVAASGAYYVACACDKIIAHPTTVTGSIGVLMQTVSFAGLMQKLGIRSEAIKSGPRKDAGSFLRDLTPEERQIFQRLIDEFHQRFIETVAAGRPKLSKRRVAELADGRVYSAKQALELGLVDQIGTLADAVAEAKRRAGLRRANVVIYHRPLGWRPNVYAAWPGQGATMSLLNVQLPGWPVPTTPQFMYLWSPVQRH